MDIVAILALLTVALIAAYTVFQPRLLDAVVYATVAYGFGGLLIVGFAAQQVGALFTARLFGAL